MNTQSKPTLRKTSTRVKNLWWIWGTAVISFLFFAAICVFIAYDNRLMSPNDTPEEFAQHTRECNNIMLISFFGGGILGSLMSVAAVFSLGKIKKRSDDDWIDS